MATPVGFEGVNQVFHAPKGSEAEIGDLQVLHSSSGIISCWRLSPEELANVVHTGVIWLDVMSQGIAPMLVSGYNHHQVPDGKGGTRPAKAEPILTRPLKG